MGYGNAARVAGWGAGLAFLALALAGAAAAECRPGSVELRWPGGAAAFRVELADTPALRAQGLMNRAEMPVSAGMLFSYATPEHAYYWMKNTLIPLDILFADEAGRVQVIHERAIPGDLTPLDGGEGVAYVLEINGGLTARMGIPIGAEMRAAAMDQAEIGWTCAQ